MKDEAATTIHESILSSRRFLRCLLPPKSDIFEDQIEIGSEVQLYSSGSS